MKIIKQLSSVGLALAIILSSCSIDKRVYTSGYHIEWKNGKHKSEKQKLLKNDSINEGIAVNNIKSIDNSDTVESQNEETDNNNQEDLLASTGNAVPLVEKKKQFSELADALILQKNIKVKLATTAKRFSDKSGIGKSKANGTRNGLLSLLGFVFSILGILLLFFISILPVFILGVTLILSALILSIIALALGSDLKGLAIAGLIISLLPIVILLGAFLLLVFIFGI